MRPFPAGLLTPVGLVVANPAFGEQELYAQKFKNTDYHGTVVWSWQLAMMARGLELQLDRCNSAERPEFCDDAAVYGNVVKAYNTLWDVIEANESHLAAEVWSWVYDGRFRFTPLGDLSTTGEICELLRRDAMLKFYRVQCAAAVVVDIFGR